MYTLDTNVIIYYLAGEENVCALLNEATLKGAPLYVSVITVGELFIYPKLTAEQEKNIHAFFSVCSIINLDILTAERAGGIGRAYNLKLPDSIIAATALFTGSTLLTRNTRDFRRVSLLAVQKI